MKGCRHVRVTMLRSLDELLPLEDELRLEAHLEACTVCAAEWKNLRLVQQGLEQQPEPPIQRIDVQAALAKIETGIEARLAEDSQSKEASEVGRDALCPERDALHWETGVSPSRRGSAPFLPSRRAARLILAAAGCAAIVIGAWAIGRNWWVLSGDPLSKDSGPGPVVADGSQAPADSITPPTQSSRDEEADRLLRVEERLSKHLLATFSPGRSLDRAWEESRPLVEELQRSGWPVARIAEQWLRHEQWLGDQDQELAQASARFLGFVGDRTSALRLEQVLEREDLAPAAVVSIGRLYIESGGAYGLGGLEEALKSTDLASRAALPLITLGDRRSAEVLAGQFAAQGSQRTLLDDELFNALTACGPPALEPLVDQYVRGNLQRDKLLDCAGRLQADAADFQALLRSDPGRISLGLQLDLARTLADPQLLVWLEERCNDYHDRDQALASLARWPGVAPVDLLVSLAGNGRCSTEQLAACASGLLDRDVARVIRWIRSEGSEPDSSTELSLLLRLFLGNDGDDDLAQLLVEFGLHPGLSMDDRVWATLALVDLESEQGLDRLAEGMLLEPEPEPRWLAAGLLALEAAGQEQAVDDLLDHLGVRRPWALRDLLEESTRRGSSAVGLFRVARSLESAAFLSSGADRPNSRP